MFRSCKLSMLSEVVSAAKRENVSVLWSSSTLIRSSLLVKGQVIQFARLEAVAKH